MMRWLPRLVVLLLLAGLLPSCSGGQCAASDDYIADGDGDCIPDLADNCPDIYNPNQYKSDDTSDTGDACKCAVTTAPTTNQEAFDACPELFLITDKNESRTSVVYLIRENNSLLNDDLYLLVETNCDQASLASWLMVDSESQEVRGGDSLEGQGLSERYAQFELSNAGQNFTCSLVKENVEQEIIDKIFCETTSDECFVIYEKSAF